MSFWVQFLPNLLATLVGAAIGVPLGLWINRAAASHAERLRRQADIQRVLDALTSIVTVLRDNRSKLLELKEKYTNETALLSTRLYTSAWDTLASDIGLGLPDPDLRRRLAYHFLHLKQFDATNERLLDLSGLGTQSIMTHSEQMAKFLLKDLTFSAGELATEADLLREQAEIAKQKLR